MGASHRHTLQVSDCRTSPQASATVATIRPPIQREVRAGADRPALKYAERQLGPGPFRYQPRSRIGRGLGGIGRGRSARIGQGGDWLESVRVRTGWDRSGLGLAGISLVRAGWDRSGLGLAGIGQVGLAGIAQDLYISDHAAGGVVQRPAAEGLQPRPGAATAAGYGGYGGAVLAGKRQPPPILAARVDTGGGTGRLCCTRCVTLRVKLG